MNSNEEYLDSLLKSVSDTKGNNKELNKVEVIPNFKNGDAVDDEFSLDELELMLDQLEGKAPAGVSEELTEQSPENLQNETLEDNEKFLDEEQENIEDAASFNNEINEQTESDDSIINENLSYDDMLEEYTLEDNMEEDNVNYEEPVIGEEFHKFDEDADVREILDSLSDDEELAEINELLQKNDNHELIEDDMMDLLSNLHKDEEVETNYDGANDFDIFADTQDVEEHLEELGVDHDLEENHIDEMEELLSLRDISQENNKSKKKEKRERKKKDKDQTLEGVDPRPGFFAKVFSYFADEDLEEDDLVERIELDGTLPTDENIAIIEELEKEKGKENKRKQKKKKSKKDKEKEEGDSSETEEGQDENNKNSGKQKKVKKEKKPKKEKIEEVEEKEKKVSKKKIIQIFAVCFSLMAVVIFIVTFIPSILENTQAKRSYRNGEYKEVYLQMYGKKLSKNDQIIFNRATTVLKIERKYDSYVNNKLMGRELEAIDALIQGVYQHDALFDEAVALGAKESFNIAYQKIIDALANEYGLSEEDARAIAFEEDDYAYTKSLENLINNGTVLVDNVYEDDSASESVDHNKDNSKLEDMLPEEYDLDSSVQNAVEDEVPQVRETSEVQNTSEVHADSGNKEIEGVTYKIEE